MKWTTETPTQPGYYWLRENKDDKDPMIIEVESSDMGLISSCCGHEGFIPTSFCAGEWYGPILPPQNKAISFSGNPVDALAEAVAISDDIETQSRFTRARAFCESINIMCHGCGKEILFKENKLYAIRVPGKHFNVNGYVYYHPECFPQDDVSSLPESLQDELRQYLDVFIRGLNIAQKVEDAR